MSADENSPERLDAPALLRAAALDVMAQSGASIASSASSSAGSRSLFDEKTVAAPLPPSAGVRLVIHRAQPLATSTSSANGSSSSVASLPLTAAAGASSPSMLVIHGQQEQHSGIRPFRPDVAALRTSHANTHEATAAIRMGLAPTFGRAVPPSTVPVSTAAAIAFRQERGYRRGVANAQSAVRDAYAAAQRSFIAAREAERCVDGEAAAREQLRRDEHAAFGTFQCFFGELLALVDELERRARRALEQEARQHFSAAVLGAFSAGLQRIERENQLRQLAQEALEAVDDLCRAERSDFARILAQEQALRHDSQIAVMLRAESVARDVLATASTREFDAEIRARCEFGLSALRLLQRAVLGAVTSVAAAELLEREALSRAFVHTVALGIALDPLHRAQQAECTAIVNAARRASCTHEESVGRSALLFAECCSREETQRAFIESRALHVAFEAMTRNRARERAAIEHGARVLAFGTDVYAARFEVMAAELCGTEALCRAFADAAAALDSRRLALLESVALVVLQEHEARAALQDAASALLSDVCSRERLQRAATECELLLCDEEEARMALESGFDRWVSHDLPRLFAAVRAQAALLEMEAAARATIRNEHEHVGASFAALFGAGALEAEESALRRIETANIAAAFDRLLRDELLPAMRSSLHALQQRELFQIEEAARGRTAQEHADTFCALEQMRANAGAALQQAAFRARVAALISAEKTNREAIRSEQDSAANITIANEAARLSRLASLAKMLSCARAYVGFGLVERGSEVKFHTRKTVSKPLLVNELVLQGPAANSGLQLGDVLLTINGHPASSLVVVRGVLASASPGASVVLRVRRCVSVSVAERIAAAAAERAAAEKVSHPGRVRRSSFSFATTPSATSSSSSSFPSATGSRVVSRQQSRASSAHSTASSSGSAPIADVSAAASEEPARPPLVFEEFECCVRVKTNDERFAHLGEDIYFDGSRREKQELVDYDCLFD